MPPGRTGIPRAPARPHFCTITNGSTLSFTNSSTVKGLIEFTLFAVFALFFSVTGYAQTNQVAEPTVIQLSQEEGVYTTTHLELAPGDYIFEVTNDGVDKDLGFYLQDATDAGVANSGLNELVGNGETSRTGVVHLEAGTYRYSCPLNPTPHYTLTVK